MGVHDWLVKCNEWFSKFRTVLTGAAVAESLGNRRFLPFRRISRGVSRTRTVGSLTQPLNVHGTSATYV